MNLHELVGNSCKLCPRECGVDRNFHAGLCKTKNQIEIASANLHFGEEPPISFKNGSGTIFFAGCNMSCIYCQNYPISQLKSAYKTVSVKELADIMLSLQKRKANNINLVTPSHFVHLICDSIRLAREKGLKVPIVYNTSSYDKEEVIELLDECVDIYLGDLKYVDSKISKELSGVSDYFEIATKALKKMYETKGKLVVKNGIARKGLIVRHLVIPGHLENSKKVLLWVKENLPKAKVSVMFQYFPAYRAFFHPMMSRKINVYEYFEIKEFVEQLDIDGWIQDVD